MKLKASKTFEQITRENKQKNKRNKIENFIVALWPNLELDSIKFQIL